MQKFLTYSGLSLVLVGLLALPAKSGSEGVETPDSSSSTGDTFAPLGFIQRFLAPIRGASAQSSNNGTTVTIIIPLDQIQAVINRFQSQVLLQIAKYAANDADALEALANGASLAEVLEQAIETLQATDPARAARIQALITRLNQLLTAVNAGSSLPQTELLVAANLDALVGELREPAETLPLQLAQADSSEAPTVGYESPVAGAVVNAVQEHNNTVQSLSNSDAVSLSEDTNFVVIADILEQIAGELRGKPVPDDQLAPINDILAAISS